MRVKAFSSHLVAEIGPDIPSRHVSPQLIAGLPL
jgi:hypothetical protein